VIESGWWAVPFSAVYTSPKMREYREWLSTGSAAARMSLGGSFHSPNVEDYYATPWVKFDHNFIGRAALEGMAEQPHRRKVTLIWKCARRPQRFPAAPGGRPDGCISIGRCRPPRVALPNCRPNGP
jgi:hypothetical protein